MPHNLSSTRIGRLLQQPNQHHVVVVHRLGTEIGTRKHEQKPKKKLCLRLKGAGEVAQDPTASEEEKNHRHGAKQRNSVRTFGTLNAD